MHVPARRALPAPAIAPPVLFAVVAAGGCGFGGPGGGVAVRDSAGVRIVENASPVWEAGEGWLLSAEAVVDIGAVDGEPAERLHDVRDATRLVDGRILVADGASGEIRSFDSRGEYLHAFGGEGREPGEFEHLTLLRRLDGDTLFVFDRRASRATVFSEAGDVLRVVSFEADGRGLRWATRMTDGTYLGLTDPGPPSGEGQGIFREPALLIRFGSDGGLRDTLGALPGDEVAVWEAETGAPPFAHRLVRASDGARVHVGTQEAFEIATYAPDGGMARILRAPADDLGLTGEEVRAHVASLLDRTGRDAPSGARRRFLERYAAAVPPPETRPAYGELRVDAAGDLWVSAYVAPGTAPTAWTVFGPDGRMLGTVAVPERFRVFEIGDDYVLGRWIDRLDVEHVRMYRLLKER